MNDIPPSKIKRTVSEPNVYALIVKSIRGQVLHLGVHFSLDEAYSAARTHLESLSPHRPGEAMDIDLWHKIPARQIAAMLVDPAKVEEVFSAPAGTSPSPVDSKIFPTTVQDILPPLESMVMTEAELREELKHMPPILQELILSRLPIQEAEPAIVSPKLTLNERVEDLKAMRNDLMRQLIEEGDIAKVEDLKALLGPYARRYVLKAIEKKQSKQTTNNENA